jgi:ATP-dependent protease HslVU (ClpYQ) peptidase subunit
MVAQMLSILIRFVGDMSRVVNAVAANWYTDAAFCFLWLIIDKDARVDGVSTSGDVLVGDKSNCVEVSGGGYAE